MSRALKALLWLGLVAWLAVDLFVVEGPLSGRLNALVEERKGGIVATVGDAKIGADELSAALRAMLWRRGEDWSALTPIQQAARREQVLQSLVDDRLLAFATRDQDHARVQRAASTEEENFARMLKFDENRLAECLSSQGMSQAQFRAQAEAKLTEQQFLERDQSNDEAAAKAWLAAHLSAIKVPRRYHAAHLFLSGHEKDKPDRFAEMQGLAAKLAEGSSFTDVVSKYSDDERTKLHGGDLGWFEEARMPADFMLGIKALKPGETSPVVRTKLGWHLIKLIEIKESESPREAELADEAQALVRNLSVTKRTDQMLTELRRDAQMTWSESALADVVAAAIQ